MKETSRYALNAKVDRKELWAKFKNSVSPNFVKQLIGTAATWFFLDIAF